MLWWGRGVTCVARTPVSVGSEGGLVVARGLAPATLLATLRLRGLLRRLLATEAALLAAGRLAVRGTASPLEVAGVAEPGEGGVLVRAAATLDRRAVGIRAPRVLVGRVVRIEIDAWLVPPGE